jgi:hypothetical protein
MKKAAKFLMVLGVLVLLSPQVQFAQENKGYVQLTLHVILSTGLSPAGTEVYLSFGYFAVADSTGTVVFDSIPEGHYDITAFKIGYDTYTLHNEYIQEDKVYNLILSEKKYPPNCLDVDPLSLEGTWCEPMISALEQDFEDPVFPPAGWWLDPDGNAWERVAGDSTGSGEIPPWNSFYAVSVGGMNGGEPGALIAPAVDLRESEGYKLTFDSFYDGSWGVLAFIEYSLDGCETWEVMTQLTPDPGWIKREIDLSAFSGPTGPEQIWFAFHADDDGVWGPGWAIDNVKIQVQEQPANYIDFWVFVDDTLVGTTSNTNWDFAPIDYGQAHTASVAARYTSGLSAKDYYTFTSEYLIPPDSLTAIAPDDEAVLTWYPPVDSWFETEYGTRDVGDVVLSFPAPTPIGLCWGICDDGENLWVTDPNLSSVTIYMLTYEGENTGTTITVSQGQSYIADMVSDGEFLYGCLVGGPNTIVKVDLATGETVGTITGDWTLTTQRGLAADFYNEEFYIGGWNSDMIWRTDFSGNTISTFGFAGVSGLAWQPLGGPYEEGALWVVSNDAASVVTEIDPNEEWATIQSFPMPGEQLFSGAGAEIKLTDPQGGCLWLPNMSDNQVYLVETDEPCCPPFGSYLPENLLGYNIYRDGIFLDYTPHTPPGEITFQGYVDEGISPGWYEYTVTAVYDLTTYGFPGDSAESMEEGPAEIASCFCFELEFVETWAQGNFEDNYWTAESDNWSVNSQVGMPAPAAEFTRDPVQENYTIGLESFPISAAGMTEGDIWFDFDLKLDAVQSTGEELMNIQVWDWESQDWSTVSVYSNADGSFGWTGMHLNITSQSMNKPFKVRFLATGVNSINIISWFVDNIHIYRQCEGPHDLTIQQTWQGNILSWYAPIKVENDILTDGKGSRNLSKYNIYRSVDGSGYELIGNAPETEYLDAELTAGSLYCYMVSAVWESESDICESAFSNEECLTVGIDDKEPVVAFRIYPNPASDYLVIIPEKMTSDREILVSIHNSSGILLQRDRFNNNGKEFRVELGNYSPGLYLVKIEGKTGIIGQEKFILISTQ